MSFSKLKFKEICLNNDVINLNNEEKFSYKIIANNLKDNKLNPYYLRDNIIDTENPNEVSVCKISSFGFARVCYLNKLTEDVYIRPIVKI